jgi:hypothetical protein
MNTKHRRKPYMPDSDLGKRNWMEQFLRVVEPDPAHFGFDDPRMFEYYQRTIREYIEAYDAVSNPALRSPKATLTKNQARKKAVAMCRDLAMQLKWDSNLTDEEKRSLGLCFEDAPPEKAKLPEGTAPGTLGFPTLVVKSSPNGGHVIRYTDADLTLKAKPKGVSHMLLFGAIGEKPNMRRTHARLLGAYPKWPFEIMYPAGCGIEGLYVTYFGRWLTTRGEMSPWSPGVSRIIADPQVSLRECEFAHLFGKEGFIDALPQLPAPPQGVAQLEADGMVRIIEDRPLLEGAVSDDHALFSALGQLEAATMRLLDAG